MSNIIKTFLYIIAILFIVGIVYKLGINIKSSYILYFIIFITIMLYHFEMLTLNIKNDE